MDNEEQAEDPGHEHLPDWISSPTEAKIWKFIYLLTFAAIATMLAVALNFYRQGEDRARVQDLAEGNRLRSCLTISLIKSSHPQTEFERKLFKLTDEHPIACSAVDTGK